MLIRMKSQKRIHLKLHFNCSQQEPGTRTPRKLNPVQRGLDLLSFPCDPSFTLLSKALNQLHIQN